MPPAPERRWPGLVAGYLALVAVVALAAVPAWVYAEPAHRPAVVRLALAAVVGVALLHLSRAARAAVEAQLASEFEAALRPAPVEGRRAPAYVTLQDEIRHGVASRQYFERVLWPRLEAVAARHRGAAGPALRRPPARRLLGRGPSLAALTALIARIEEGT